MVVVKLMGGLGNQMFQYACGRRLAHARSAPLKLDVSDLGKPSGRAYGLHHFDIRAELASHRDLQRFKQPNRLTRLLNRAGLVSVPYRARHVVRERHFHFDKKILSLDGENYLEGYWQSERYFADIESLIRCELSCKHDPDQENARLMATIVSKDSVSIHVRRGDYVSDPKTSRVHGVCGWDYYARAVALVSKAVRGPQFFVFSDDPKWVKDNFRLGQNTTYVDHNAGDRSHEDLRLMSACKHHVIANSSFSWWSAWLSRNPGKMVIAPSKWFHDDAADTRDLLPPSWLKT
jgi:hypothetical protein